MAPVVDQLTALFGAFNARDWSAFDAVVDGFDEAFTLTLPRSGRDPVTRADYPALVRSQVDEHPELRYELRETFTSDGSGAGQIVMTLDRRYTRRGEPFVLPLCLVAEVAGDAVRSITEYAGAPRG